MHRNPNGLKTILYIEDDEGLARLLQKRMHRLGLTVEIATSGEEGIKKFDPAHHQLMLIDYYLPGISGIDVLRELNPQDISNPLILLTGAGDEKVAVEALKLGAADYVIKDVGQVYLDLLPAVMSAAFTRVQLLRENRQQQQTLIHYSEKLRLSEERLNRAIESSQTGVWDWNLETNELFWSPNLCREVELPEGAEPTLEHVISRVHPDDREKMKQAIDDALSGRTPIYQVIYREKPSPDEKGFEWVWRISRGAVLRDPSGKPYRMLGTRSNFTQHKMMEQQLEESKNKAEAASLTKSEFLATMSHEIRTPMNAVIGLTTILAQTQLSERQRELVNTLQSSADSLLLLINDVLDISRIEANQIMLEQVPFSPAESLREICDMMQTQARSKRLQLTLEAESLQSKRLYGDHMRFRQIITNLCSNAIKFTEKGGVHIYAECTPAETPNQCYLEVRIEDTGIGIEPEKLETIFDKFVQADQSITRRFGGTGLGLSICRSLARLMDGDIYVQSVPNEGSVFTFKATLNVAPDAVSVKPKVDALAKIPDTSVAGRPLILLVEDYPANVMVATLLLDSIGYNVDAVPSGALALEHVQEKSPYAAILMDVQMQGMDGFETTRRIRDYEKEKNMPPHYIIGVTAHAMAGDRERCLNAGMNEYLSKPINIEELTAKLRYAEKMVA